MSGRHLRQALPAAAGDVRTVVVKLSGRQTLVSIIQKLSDALFFAFVVTNADDAVSG